VSFRTAHAVGPYTRRTTCRICGGGKLISFLDFGDMPLAGDFVPADRVADVLVYPMDLAVCEDCTLVQILNVVSGEILFNDYRYLSSVMVTLSSHFRDYAAYLKKQVLPTEDPFVVEFGCNDGVLLMPLRDLGVRTVGVDAAENVVELARSRGHDVKLGFFGLTIAEEIIAAHGKPSVITASNVFAHIDDLDEVMRGVDMLLRPDGTFIVEVHYLVDLLKTLQFDTVYHEHLCYYSLHALSVLYERFGFMITDVVRLPMHGGAIRVLARRVFTAPDVMPTVEAMYEEERAEGIGMTDTYRKFGANALHARDRLRDFLQSRISQGRTLSAYGAAGRATILLNYTGLDASMVRYVIDESPFRCGRYVPGVDIPIVAPSELRSAPTDDCLMTAWNYRDEILAKSQDYLALGGTFILPLPEIETIRQ
jgi:SAM-dependent methyltransferase